MDLNTLSSGPPGIRLLRRSGCFSSTIRVYQSSVLIITFVAYACFHASRKPISIVKGVLKSGWDPFDGKNATGRLGEIDVAFLLVYSLGMYLAGHLGDRFDLRIFLTMGMIGSGIFVALFGMGYWFNIHSFFYYLCIQMVQGLFQATGWPSVVAIVGSWFGKGKRGLIMGIWNSHTSIGNICGSLIAASVMQYGWGWSFVLPGILISVAGIMVYLFLAVNPENIGFSSGVDNIGSDRMLDPHKPEEDGFLNEKPPTTEPVKMLIELSKRENLGVSTNTGMSVLKTEIHADGVNGKHDIEESPLEGEEERLLQSSTTAPIHSSATNAVGFIEAWMIPGVASYSLCLFFSKLVAYTFLYWLPFYIKHTGRVNLFGLRYLV